jgi:hypothetical protein
MPMNPRLLRPLATGFDPRSLANLTGWYLATDSTSYTESSGQISEWRDKSGAGNHITQTTGNNRPTLFESSSDTQNSTRAVINGRQALFFDGVNDRLQTTNTVTSGQSRTVFAVARRTNNSSIGTVATFGQTTVGLVNRWACRYGTTGSLHVGGDSITTNQNISTLPAWDSAHLSCWSQNSGTRNLTYLLNNTSFSITGNPPNAQTSFAGLTVGMLVGGTVTLQYMNGFIGELVIYDRELTVAERDRVTRGIAARWGIAVA